MFKKTGIFNFQQNNVIYDCIVCCCWSYCATWKYALFSIWSIHFAQNTLFFFPVSLSFSFYFELFNPYRKHCCLTSIDNKSRVLTILILLRYFSTFFAFAKHLHIFFLFQFRFCGFNIFSSCFTSKQWFK